MTIRQTVIDLRTNHPEWTLEKIGQAVNRTRERVRQILISENLEQRSTKAAYSRLPSHLKKGPPCKKCGTPVPYKDRSYDNGYKGGSYPIYCSYECRPKEEEIELTCFYCNNTYVLTVPQAKSRQRRVANGRYKATYCSHSCSIRAYWDVVHGKTPNTFGYNLEVGPRGVKRGEIKNLSPAEVIIKTISTTFLQCPRCTHEWKPRTTQPKSCPSCQVRLGE